MDTWIVIALVAPLWIVVLLLVLAFFRGAQLLDREPEPSVYVVRPSPDAECAHHNKAES